MWQAANIKLFFQSLIVLKRIFVHIFVLFSTFNRVFIAFFKLAHNVRWYEKLPIGDNFLFGYTKVEADYNPSQTTETLIGYTECCGQFIIHNQSFGQEIHASIDSLTIHLPSIFSRIR